MLLEGRLRGALALALLAAPAWAAAPSPEIESWGAYDVRHLPLPGIYWDMAVLTDSAAVIPAASQVHFVRPDGRMAGQFSSDGYVGPHLAALRGGGFAVSVYAFDPKAKRIDKIVFLGPDGRRRGEYVADSWVQSLAALRDGNLAVGLASGLIFLGPDGQRLGRLGTEACWDRSPISGNLSIWNRLHLTRGIRGIIELPDGRLLLRGGLTGGPGARDRETVGRGRKAAHRWEGSCLVSRDRRKARLWTPNTPEMPRGVPHWILKNGVIVGTNADGLVFMDVKGSVLHRTNARIAGQPPIFTELAELRDGGVAACSGVTGLIFVVDARGRERWHFKAGGPVWGAPLELSNGNIVFGSENHSVYFLGKDGTLLGRYQSEGSIRSRLLELSDGVVLAALTGRQGSSHNLLLFTPTGRPFVPPRSLAGKHCRIAYSSFFPAAPSSTAGRQSCPTDPETIPFVRENFFFYRVPVRQQCSGLAAGQPAHPRLPVLRRRRSRKREDAGEDGRRHSVRLRGLLRCSLRAGRAARWRC